MNKLVTSSLEEAYRLTIKGREKSGIFDHSLFKRIFLDQLATFLNSVWRIQNEFAGKIFIKRSFCYFSWTDSKRIPKLTSVKFVPSKEIAEGKCILLNRVLSEVDYDWLYFASLNNQANGLLNWSAAAPVKGEVEPNLELSTEIKIDFSEIQNIKYE